ncbi:MAG: tRNA (N6-threonylcarbamoyladenosine(37)-N6)-methyltransferase TrmO [Chloroflexota bacterium]
MENIVMQPIGTVHNEVAKGEGQVWAEVTSELRLREGLEETLDGIEEFSHIVVLYYMHRTTPGQFPTKVHPRGRQDLPLVGVLATRHSTRPNSVGLTTARLLGREGLVLRVQGLDAFDGTPVLDIKPSMPGSDYPTQVTVPEWVKVIQAMPHRASGDAHR